MLAAVTESTAAPQPRLHLPARFQAGAVEIAVRLPDPHAKVWVRTVPPHSDDHWEPVAEADKRECKSDVHVAVLVVPGPDRAGARAVDDAVVGALSGLLRKTVEMKVSVSVVRRQMVALNPFGDLNAATAQLEGQYQAFKEPPVAADVVLALGHARNLLEEQRTNKGGQGRYLVLLVIDGMIDLKAPELGEKARELTESDVGIELYRIATPKLVSDLDDYAGHEDGPDLVTAGNLLREMIESCQVIRIAGCEVGTTRIRIANGASSPSWISPEITVSIAANDLATVARGGPRWWIWTLLGLGMVLLGGVVWTATRRTSSTPLHAPPRSATGIQVVRKTLPLQPGGGRTLPLSLVAASSGETVQQLPPPGLAAWFVVYWNGVPCDTLALQTIGVTTVGRSDSNSISLDDSTVSKRHATITAAGARFVLEDTKDPRPQNPTKVDGKPLNGPIELRDGMRVQIGSTRLRFKCTA